jgi:hypothetical protein
MNRVLLAALLILTVVFSSCKKDELCVGGSGGSAGLILYPVHHTEPIFSTPNVPNVAFIKYNASEFPGTDPSAYDIVVFGEPGTDFIEIGGLRCGTYYVYMSGYDPAILQGVSGGIPIRIAENSGVYRINVPVTE